MLQKKRKRKISHMVLVTSDAADAGVKQFRIKSWALWIVIVVLCVITGILIGYIAYEDRIWVAMDNRSDLQTKQIATLQETNAGLRAEKLALELQIADQEKTIQILSDTINQHTKTIQEMQDILDKQSTPTEFPLSGSAAMDTVEDDEIMCVFTVAVGKTVTATAMGTVTDVEQDEEFGYRVVIDHGNGYVTIYRNGSTPLVKPGDSVYVGRALYEITKKHEKMGYQIMKDEVYINPEEMLSISG
ncbi:MAG: peptidoglycan DD-metalloendopeptidase family protein [Lachnospiraceae bacterium]|nr:peptidoglycan DD-metalloendopeptidase family protein [Lachnospiraceae bacterium]